MMFDRKWLIERQDRLDKNMIDQQHRLDIHALGYCRACGLPHGDRCQCLTLREAVAGVKADA